LVSIQAIFAGLNQRSTHINLHAIAQAQKRLAVSR
jgi:hypothetical protein